MSAQISSLMSAFGPGGWGFAATAAAIFAALAARYFLLAGLSYWFFWKRDPSRWGGRRVYQQSPGGHARSEIVWSLATCLAYGLAGAFVVHAWREGWTMIYTDVGAHGWGYLALSFVLVGIFHETYFYWMHRLMHVDPLYRAIHRVHHQFVQPGPWAAFSFHPVEVVSEHLILFALVFLIPLHPGVIAAYLVAMAVSGIINHLGVEIYPGGRVARGFGRWVIGATHHAQHHRLYHYNYGLYFTFWDRVAGTQHPDFERDFARVTTPDRKVLGTFLTNEKVDIS